MKDIPKEKVKNICPICRRKSLYRTFWGKINMDDPYSDDNWRYGCATKIESSFGVRNCYFNTPIVRLAYKYKGEIDWSKIKNLTDPIHPVIKEAIDKAVIKKKFVS